MRAAFECRLVQAGLRQHGACQLDMWRLTGMRGAGQRQLPITEAVGIGSAALDQRQRLDRLDRRTREHRLCRVADLPDGLAVGVEDGNSAAMGALDESAAQDFDQNRICHVTSRKCGRVYLIRSRMET